VWQVAAHPRPHARRRPFVVWQPFDGEPATTTFDGLAGQAGRVAAGSPGGASGRRPGADPPGEQPGVPGGLVRLRPRWARRGHHQQPLERRRDRLTSPRTPRPSARSPSRSSPRRWARRRPGCGSWCPPTTTAACPPAPAPRRGSRCAVTPTRWSPGRPIRSPPARCSTLGHHVPAEGRALDASERAVGRPAERRPRDPARRRLPAGLPAAVPHQRARVLDAGQPVGRRPVRAAAEVVDQPVRRGLGGATAARSSRWSACRPGR